jgi:PAS domain S-box-containing protein
MKTRWQLKAGFPAVQWLLLAIAMLILGGVIGWNLYAERNTIESLEGERLAHNARVIEDNLVYQLVATNLALDSIRKDLSALKARDKAQLDHHLKSMSDAMPGVRTLIILDAEGSAIASNREELSGRNFREREYFQAARRSRDAAMLLVSPPFKTVLGVFAMNLTKVIIDERGAFAGAIVATLDPEYFNILLDSVRYAPEVWTSLAHGDGKLFLMMPARTGIEGVDLAQPGSFYTRHRDSGQKATLMSGMVYATGEERMLAQRTIQPAHLAMDNPLLLAVTRDLQSIFIPWRQKAYVQGSLFALLLLVSTLGLYFLQKRQRLLDSVTSLREAEEQRNAEQYQSIIQSSLDGFWITDTRGRIVDANESVCRMHGYTREELLSMAIPDIEADESAAEVATRTRQMMDSGRAQFEARHRRKDGTLIDVEVSVQFVVGLDERFFAFIRDITARKQAEEALHKSETRFRKMFEHNDAVMLLIDPESGALIDANAAAARFYGYPVERLRTMRIDQINALTPEEVAARRAQAVKHQSNVFIFPHRLASGEMRTVEVRSSPIEVSGRVVLFSIVQDITERETATAELKRSNAELEQFSYAISHDMRQPLRMISSYMQLLETEFADQLQGERREFFDFAIDGAKRLDQMLVALLEYSRVGRMGEPPVWVESCNLRDETLLFLQPMITEAKAVVHIEGEWPRIFVSPDEILRLLQNLIGNALKFRVAGRVPEITLSSETSDSEWRLRVVDNGVGIPPDQIDRLFQVFQRLQARTAYEGTGVGLALCRKIAEHHGGRIWAESAGTGQGSRFCVILPLRTEAEK